MDSDLLAAGIAGANIPALAAALALLTGDPTLPRRWQRPRSGGIGDLSGLLPDSEQAEIRALASQILPGHIRAGAPPPKLPSEARLMEILNWIAGETVDPIYLPFVLEDIRLEGGDPRRFEWQRRPPADALAEFNVLVIGAGAGGLLAAMRLRQAGIQYQIVEKNSDIGGTWHENTYPGAAVDTPNHYYCYSFEPNPSFSRFYSKQAEIKAYLTHCARKHGVLDGIRFDTEVTLARFDETAGLWRVSLRAADGRTEEVTANAVVSAVGMLSRPFVPDIAGADRFAGPVFHSARWRHDVDLAGRRVAVIGTGASALQFAPTIQPQVGRLTIFQRTAQWATPNPTYHATVDAAERWMMGHVPLYLAWFRFLLFWNNGDRFHALQKIDPDWRGDPLSLNAGHDLLRQFLTHHIKETLKERPDLLAKALPDYPPLVKRGLLDNHWFRMLTQPNVELVTERIERIETDAVVTVDGVRHETDMVIWGTGFHAGRFLYPMDFVGVGGERLQTRWENGENPRAHLGITVPGFPNLFCLYGPNTNPVSGNVISTLECQVTYIMGCLRALLEGGHRTMECRVEPFAAYNRRLDAATAGMAYSHRKVRNYYQNSEGRIITSMPWTNVHYWQLTRAPDLNDFVLRK